jgi:putative transposase
MTDPADFKRLKRWETAGWRYLTCSTNQRFAFFSDAHSRDTFARKLEHARQRHRFELLAWVLMPEHFHMILRPPRDGSDVPRILQTIKQGTAQSLLAHWRRQDSQRFSHALDANGSTRLWQAGGGFDRNVRDGVELDEEVAYIHHNPVERGLVASEMDWAWSSARHYAHDHSGIVKIEYRLFTPYREGGPDKGLE